MAKKPMPFQKKGAKAPTKGKLPPGAVKVAGPKGKETVCPDCGKKLRKDGTCSCGYGE